jgi:hypothetical protein
VQNLLLSLGVILLAVAALIFTAYAWGRLGITGRGLILLAVTAAVAVTARVCLRRDLVATAEALGTLTVVLTLLDAYAARRVDLVGLADVHAPTYWAGAIGLVSALSAAYTYAVPLRSTRWAAAVGLQLPLPVLVADASDVSDAVRSGWLAAQAAVVVTVATRLRGHAIDLTGLGLLGAGAAWTAALGLAASDAVRADRASAHRGALAVVGVAAVAALTSWLWRHRAVVREASSGTSTVLLVLAALAAAHVDLPGARVPTVVAAVGLAAVIGAALLPRLFQRAPLSVAGATVAAAVAGVAVPVVTALVAPFGWVGSAWSGNGGGSARAALAPALTWTGTRDVLVVLLVSVVTAVILSELFDRRRQGLPVVAGLLATALLVAPLSLDWGYRVAVGWDLVAGVLLTAVVVPYGRARPVLARASYVAGIGTLSIAVAWSLADAETTVVAFGLVALLMLALAVLDATTRPSSAMLAAAVGCAEVVAVAVRANVALVTVGFLLAVAVAVVAFAGQVLGRRERLTGALVAGVAVAAYVVALAMAAADPGWAAWTLLVGAGSSALLSVRADAASPEAALRPVLAGTAASLLAVCTPTFAHSVGAHEAGVGFVLACTAGLLAVVGHVLARRDAALGAVVGAVGAVAYAASFVPSVADAGWLAWALLVGFAAAGTLTALARAGRADAALRPAYAALTAALACAGTTAYAYSTGAPQGRTAFVLACTAAAAAVAARVALSFDESTARAVAIVAGVGYVFGLSTSVDDPGWLAWTLLLGAVAAALGACTTRPVRAPLAASAAVLGCAWVGVFAGSIGTPTDRTGFYVAVAGAAALLAGALLRRDPQTGSLVDGVGAIALVVAVLMVAQDLGWLSWTLALAGVTALAESLRPDRRWAGYLGGALITCWSWTRLAIADVTAPEAYAAPLALTALVLGHLRRRQQPRMSSWVAYGSGLGAAFGPSLTLAVNDPGLTRPLLLGLAALVVVVFGARERLQAPLVIGGATLLVDAVAQVGPYAADLPRWVSIAAAGLVLLLLGATFEQRRRDLDRLRAAFAAMS